MKSILHPAMIEAARLTRAGHLAEATRLIQSVLTGGGTAATSSESHPASPPPSAPITKDATVAPNSSWSGRRLGKLADIVKELQDGGGALPRQSSRPPSKLPEGALFLTGHYENNAGSREYKLYVPSNYQRRALPLVVMLHGCTQSADDFAAGTRMNTVAEERGFLVAYPMQTNAANPSKCWNWFKPIDQQRGSGEPSLIAGLTQHIARDYSVDQRRIYVAGLSAGGAAAAIVGAAYPDIFAAVGVHSGLPAGAASDLPSALAAMRQGIPRVPTRILPHCEFLPTIVFHGDKDGTVHPANGARIIEQLKSSRLRPLQSVLKQGQAVGGHTYSQTCYLDPDDRVVMEMWLVHNSGHAWSGGCRSGSYTDPQGPDASREMARFFFDHTLRPKD